MTTLKEKIEVMQAAEEGKPIQVKEAHRTVETAWMDTDDPVWDWSYNTYRVKPAPRELWVNVYPDGCPTYVAKGSREAALNSVAITCTERAVLFREVIED